MPLDVNVSTHIDVRSNILERATRWAIHFLEFENRVTIRGDLAKIPQRLASNCRRMYYSKGKVSKKFRGEDPKSLGPIKTIILHSLSDS